MKNKIKNLTFLSIFMLFALNSNVFSDEPKSYFHSCDKLGCEEFTTTFTMSEFVRVKECVVEVFFDLWTCPEDVFTINLKGFNLDCGGAPVPTNAEIMTAIKKYLLAIAHLFSSNGEIYPNNFDVEILSPSCYYLFPEGFSRFSASFGENIAMGYDECDNSCCSNTYTLNAIPSITQIVVSNIERSTDNETSSTCNLSQSHCINACAEDEIEEGPITYDYYGCGLPGTEIPYLFGETLTQGYTPNRKYMSYVHYSTNGGGSYNIQPRSIYGHSSIGVANANDMKNYIMDLLFSRVSLFGVNASDKMNLYINQCWSNYDGNAFPCVEECCHFEISFVGHQNTIINIVDKTMGPSATCTSPCFEVCEKIMELNNQQIINAKQNIEIEDNPNIYEDLKIIPNPSSGITNIQFKSEDTGSVEMYILTLDGQTIAVRNIAKESNIVNYEFNTKTFSNGTYFVKIFLNGQQRITKKIIIQN